MAFYIWQISFLVFVAITMLHLHVSPFTKVEESFNMQAIHDILEYGVPMSNVSVKLQTFFDHMTFPGAVPRTFIGSLVVSGLATPDIWIGNLVGKAAQTHIRAVLGGLNASALAIFARSVQRAYGPIVATWYVVLQASQFHLWYYASRTLPNMFAFPLSTIASACLLPSPTSRLGPVKRTRLGLYLLTVATVIFRSELALLLGPHCLWLLLKPETLDAKIRLFRTVLLPSIVPGALIALLLTVTVDTYFWQSKTLLWPELSAFLANIFPTGDSQGASDWGTQPFYWYLLVALPRLLMNQVFMLDLFFMSSATLQDMRVLDNMIPSYAYLLLYSILPHKETRFLFPIVPSLTLVAAMTCARLTINASRQLSAKIFLYAVILSTAIVGFVSHAVLLPLSALNYPGGVALQNLHAYHQSIHLENPQSSARTVNVHLTNLALQSGVNRFLERPPAYDSASPRGLKPTLRILEGNDVEERPPITLQGDANHPALTITPQPRKTQDASPKSSAAVAPRWIYDKTSNDTKFLEPTFWSQFDYAVVENPRQAIGAWEIIKEVRSLGRPRLLKPGEVDGQRCHSSKRSDSGISEVLKAIYLEHTAKPLVYMTDLAHDILRLGRHLPIATLTKGYWLELPLETRLYILKRTVLGTDPNLREDSHYRSIRVHGSQNIQPVDSGTDIPMLEAKAEFAQRPLGIDELGPLVVNKDGTLSRLENWQQMTAREKKRTIEYLKKRNMLRLEGAEAVAV